MDAFTFELDALARERDMLRQLLNAELTPPFPRLSLRPTQTLSLREWRRRHFIGSADRVARSSRLLVRLVRNPGMPPYIIAMYAQAVTAALRLYTDARAHIED